jgi:hypothetical protein
MHSWVFRHRARLRVIYGVAAERPAEPAPRPARRLKPGHGAARGVKTAPGTIRRGATGVTLRPMRRRAG